MLMPKRTKYLKQMRGRRRGKATRGNVVQFGDYGIQALEPAWVTSRQIEAVRQAMVRHNPPSRQSVDPHLPRQAGYQTRRGDADGQGQGLGGILGGGRQTRSRAL